MKGNLRVFFVHRFWLDYKSTNRSFFDLAGVHVRTVYNYLFSFVISNLAYSSRGSFWKGRVFFWCAKK